MSVLDKGKLDLVSARWFCIDSEDDVSMLFYLATLSYVANHGGPLLTLRLPV